MSAIEILHCAYWETKAHADEVLCNIDTYASNDMIDCMISATDVHAKLVMEISDIVRAIIILNRDDSK